MITETTAPDRIAKDDYQGKYTIRGSRKSAMWSAKEIAQIKGEGIIWESFGRINGREHFGRTRYVADAKGNLHCYDSAGRKVIIHRAARKLRLLTV